MRDLFYAKPVGCSLLTYIGAGCSDGLQGLMGWQWELRTQELGLCY